MAKDSASKLAENFIENTQGLRPLEARPALEVESSFTLGLRQRKKLIIGDLQMDGPTFDPAFMSFRSQVSNAVQAMSLEPTNIVNDSQEVTSIRFAVLS